MIESILLYSSAGLDRSKPRGRKQSRKKKGVRNIMDEMGRGGIKTNLNILSVVETQV